MLKKRSESAELIFPLPASVWLCYLFKTQLKVHWLLFVFILFTCFFVLNMWKVNMVLKFTSIQKFSSEKCPSSHLFHLFHPPSEVNNLMSFWSVFPVFLSQGRNKYTYIFFFLLSYTKDSFSGGPLNPFVCFNSFDSQRERCKSQSFPSQKFIVGMLIYFADSPDLTSRTSKYIYQWTGKEGARAPSTYRG